VGVAALAMVAQVQCVARCGVESQVRWVEVVLW
jgi:hypothetical protein